MDIRQSTLNKANIDKFQLVFQLPPALMKIKDNFTRSSSTIAPDTMQFSVYGSPVPPTVVKAVEQRYRGSNIFVSSHSRDSYTPISVKFKIDNEFNNYWVIYQWINLLHDDYTGLPDNRNLIDDDNAIGYITDMSIYGCDELNNRKIKWTYEKAFPVTLGGIEYNNQTDEQIDCFFEFVFAKVRAELV